MTNREWLNGLSVEDYTTALRAWLEAEHEEPAPTLEEEEHQLRPGDIIRDSRTWKGVIVTRASLDRDAVSVLDEDGNVGVLFKTDNFYFSGVHLSALENVLQQLKNVNENAMG